MTCSKENPKYVVWIKFPYLDDRRLHMTLCYVGSRTKEEIERIKYDIRKDLINILPLEVRFGEYMKLGPLGKENILARKCNVNDSTKFQYIQNFYDKWYCKEEGEVNPEIPNLHISIKEEFKNEVDKFESFIGCDIQIKGIGKSDPIFTTSL